MVGGDQAAAGEGRMKVPTVYQTIGAKFLVEQGVLLADDPGLGKTLQAILACQQINAQCVPIICPAVALSVWKNEILDCWPECTPIYLRDLVEKRGLRIPVGPVAVITSPDYLVTNLKAATVFASLPSPDVFIGDEAQMFKNPATKRTIMVYGPGCAGGGLASLSKRIWLLSATIMLNHAGELFPHLRATAPERIEQKSYVGFTSRYCEFGTQTIYLKTKPGQRAQTKQIEKIVGSNRAMLPDLAKRMRGWWLRRKLSDVMDQVPSIRLVPRLLPADACDQQYLEGVEDSPEAEALRKALANGDLTKLQALEGQMSRIRRLLALAKVKATVAWIEDLFEQGVPKVSVWGWHVEALERIRDGLSAYDPIMITGATPTSSRPALAKKFQEDPACRVSVGQIAAAGVAIDLDAAKRCVCPELAWTPAMNKQFLLRHFRAAKGGRQLPVLGEALVIDGSIDEAVGRTLARKSAEIEMLEESA
jgi:SWI/SNF-related matrix-associated actin-dependent regulator 1 of chromatin subfamily A